MAINDPRSPGRFRGTPFVPNWLRLLAIVAVIGFAWFSQRAPAPNAPPPEDPWTAPAPSTSQPTAQLTPPATNDSARRPQPEVVATVPNVTLKDQAGRVIYRGDIDLQPTLDRIAAGKRLDRFSHDGSTFQNRERKLPRQPPDYYKEFVVITPKVSGPGPQRLIVGEEGEIYYTHDHYKSFRRIR